MSDPTALQRMAMAAERISDAHVEAAIDKIAMAFLRVQLEVRWSKPRDGISGAVAGGRNDPSVPGAST